MSMLFNTNKIRRRFERYKKKLENSFIGKSKLNIENNFEVEALEKRILLSADPVLGAAQAILPKSYEDANQNIELPQKVQISEAIKLDIKDLNEALKIQSINSTQDNFILSGSGTLEKEYINDGIVAPGYSPGIQNYSAGFTQTSTGTLIIELGGTNNSDTTVPQYDQINVTGGTTALDGTLDVEIYNGYEIKEGDVFNILTSSSNITGKFSNGEGLFGFGDGSLYLDIEQTNNSITLTAKKIADGVKIDSTSDVEKLYLSEALNIDYFNIPDDQVVDVSGKISIGDNVFIEGNLSLNLSTQNVNIESGILGSNPAGILDVIEGVSSHFLDITITDGYMFFGNNGDFHDNIDLNIASGVLISDIDLAFSLITVDDARIVPFMKAPVFYTLSGNVQSAQLIGFDFMSAQIANLSVSINSSAGWLNGDTPTINYIDSFGENGYEIVVGNNTLSYTQTTENYQIEIAQAQLQIADFLYLQGSFSFKMGNSEIVTLNTGLESIGSIMQYIPGINDVINDVIGLGGLEFNEDYSSLSGVEVSVMTLGASNVQAFIGTGSAYKQDFDWSVDSDGDGNYYNDFYYNTSATGVVIEDLEFAMAIFSVDTPIISEYLSDYYAINLTVKSAGFVGLSEDINNNGILDKAVNVYSFDKDGNVILDIVSEDGNGDNILNSTMILALRDVTLRFNSGSSWANSGIETSINFEKSFLEPYAISTGLNTVYIDFNTALFELQVKDAQLQVSEFLYLRGEIVFSKVSGLNVVVNTGDLGDVIDALKSDNSDGLAPGQINMNVNALTIGATNMYGFVGVGGAPWIDLNNDGEITGDEEKWANGSATGFTVIDADLAFALMTPDTVFVPDSLIPKFLSLKVDVDYAGLVGIDDITMNIQDFQVDINTLYVSSSNPLYSVYAYALVLGALPNIDYRASFKGEDTNNNNILDADEDSNGDGILNRGLLMSTDASSANAFYIDFESEVLTAKGYAEINIYDVFQVSAGFFVGKTTQEVSVIDLLDNSVTRVSTMALNFAIIDAYGYIGQAPQEGSYWIDKNGDGKITSADEGTKTNESVIGLEVEELDLGISVHREIGALNSYTGVIATLPNIEFVGVDGFELRASDFMFYLNSGSGFNPTKVIDFSKSGKLQDDGTYASFSLDIAQNLSLDFKNLDTLMIVSQGLAIARVYNSDDTANYLKISAAFSINISLEGINLFFDGDVEIADNLFSVHSQGFLVLDSAGVVGKFSVDTNLNVENYISFHTAMTLKINTTGDDYTYLVPKDLQQVVGYETIEVSATPPNMFHKSDAYISLEAEGSLTLLNTLTLEGDFSIVITTFTVNNVSSLQAELNVSAVLNLAGLTSLGVAGTLGMVASTDGNLGIYGSLEVGGDPMTGGAKLIDTGVFNVYGGFLLQVNLTNTTQSVTRLITDENGTVIGTTQQELEAYSLKIAGAATLQVSVVELKGSFDVYISSSSVYAKIDMGLELGDYGLIQVGGAIMFINNSSEVAFAFNSYFDANLTLGPLKITADANLQFNTSSTTEYLGVQAGTIFKLDLLGDVDISGIFKATFSGGIDFRTDYFEFRIDDASINFYDFIDIGVSGYFNSHGEWNIKGNADVYLPLGPLKVSGGVSIELGNDIFAAEIYGQLRLYFDVWWFPTIDIVLAGFSAGISISSEMAIVHGSITILGMGFSGTAVLRYDDAAQITPPDPIIATKEGETLYLNTSDRAEYREINGNSYYKDYIDDIYYVTTAEMYYLKQGYTNEQLAQKRSTINDFDNAIVVESLGITTVYTGVSQIIMNGGEGNDFLMVDNGVKQKITANGGVGNDEFVIVGGSSDSVYYGGAGNDKFSGNVDKIKFYGEDGNDKFQALEVLKRNDDAIDKIYEASAIIYTGSGANSVEGSIYADTIYSQGDLDRINTYDGDDVVYMSLGSSAKLDLGNGFNTVILDNIETSSPIILGDNKLSYGNSVLNFNTTVGKIEITDIASSTIIQTNYENNIGWENTDLFIKSSGVFDLSNAEFKLSNNNLTLIGYGFTDTIYTDSKSISILNYSLDSLTSDINVVARNSLEIVTSNVDDLALFSQSGNITVAVENMNDTISVISGKIVTQAPLRNIEFKSNNLNLNVSSENIKGLGDFIVTTELMKQSYRIGSLGLTSLTGKELRIEFIDTSLINVSDRFEIFTFENTQGNFSTGEGFFGFKSDYYLDVDTSNGKLEVVVKEFLPGNSFDFVSDFALNELDLNAKQNNTIGMWLNYDYFDGIPIEITIDITLNIQNALYISGQFTLRYQDNYLLTLADSKHEESNWEDVLAVNYSFASVGTTAFIGTNYGSDDEKGIKLEDVDIALLFFDAKNVTDNRSWLYAQASIKAASFLGFDGIKFNSSSFELYTSQGFGTNSDGSDNTSVVNLLVNPFELGLDKETMITLNDDGSLGERLSVGGTADISVGEFNLQGSMAFAYDDIGIKAVGKDITSVLKTDDFGVGLENGDFGLILSEKGVVLEASGSFLMYGDGLGEVSADEVFLRYNNTGIDYSNTDITIGSYTYTYGNFGTANDIAALSITNLKVTLYDSFTLSGSFGVEKAGDEIKIISTNANTTLNVGDLSIGVQNATFAMLVNAQSQKVIQTSGGIFASLGEDINISAQMVSFKMNETQTDYSDISISAGNLSYTFDDLSANLTTPKIAVDGANIKLYDNFELSGNFAFSNLSNQTVNLSDNTTASVDLMQIGASEVNLFVGNDAGTNSQVGLMLGGVNIALVLASERNTNRSWLSLKSTANTSSFEGLEDITLEAKDVNVLINTQAQDNTVIDYSLKNLEVLTGISSSITMDMNGSDGEIIQVGGFASVDLTGDLSFEGNFALQIQASKDIYISQNTVQVENPVDASFISIGFSDLSLFVGDDKGTKNEISDDFGLALSNVDLALALFSDNNSDRSWVTLKANVEEINLYGMNLSEDIILDVQNAAVNFNLAASDGSVVDYVKTSGETNFTDLTLKAGDSDIVFDIEGNYGQLIQVSGDASLNFNNFIVIDGSFGFESKSAVVITTADYNKEILTNSSNFTFYNTNAFIGFDKGTTTFDDDMGVRLTGIDLTLAFFQEVDGNRTWASVDSSIESVDIYGIKGVNLEVNDASIVSNIAANDGSVIDFAYMTTKDLTHSITIPSLVQSGDAVTFSADGYKGEFVEVVTDVNIEVYDYFYASGKIGIQASTQSLYTNNSSQESEYNVIAFTAKDIDAFVGVVDENTKVKTGLTLNKADFALAVAVDVLNPQNIYLGLQSNADGIGLDLDNTNMDFKLKDISVTLNVGLLATPSNEGGYNISLSDKVIDFAKSKTELGSKIGSDETFILDINGNYGTTLKTQFNTLVTISDFFAVEGYFTLEIGTNKSFILNDGTQINNAAMFSFGAGDLTGYVGTNIGSENFIGLALDDVSFTLAVVTSGIDTWVATQAKVGYAGFEGLGDAYVIEAQNIDVAININSVSSKAIDFEATQKQLDVNVGTQETIILDMSTTTLQASGSFAIKIQDFFYTSGSIVFEQRKENIVLNTGEQVEVNTLTTGAINLNGFVGFGYGTENKAGFEIDNLDFAFVVLSDVSTNRSWTTLKAEVSNIGFVGIDNFELSGSGVVNINMEANDGTLVDYSSKNLVIAPKGSVDGIVIDIEKSNDNVIAIEGDFKFGLYNFISFEKHISFSQNFKSVVLSDGRTTAVGYISFSQTNIDMFAGFNQGSDNEVGLKISDAQFGLGIFVEMSNPTNIWLSAQAQIDTIEFVGVDNVTLSANELFLEINTSSMDGTSIDFATKNVVLSKGIGAAFGGTSIGDNEGITLDMKGEKFAFRGNINLSLFDVVSMSGNFVFSNTKQEILLSDGKTTVANVLVMEASDINAFTGFNLNDEAKVGFDISNLDFAFALFNDTVDTKREWISVQASADFIGFGGIDGLEIGGENIHLTINQSAYDNTLIDYTAMNGINLDGLSFDINIDTNLGSHISFGGDLRFNAFGIVQLQEEMSFIFEFEKVKLSDGTFDDVIVLSVAFTDISIFAGVNGGSNSEVGLKVSNMDLGLALSYSMFTQRTWLGLQGKASGIELVGLDGLIELSAQEVELSMNLPDLLSATAIDYESTPLSLPSLNGGSDFIMDMSGSAGASATLSITDATMVILDFVHVKGDIGFSVGGPVTLNVETTDNLSSLSGGLIESSELAKQFLYMTIAVSDADIYVGLNEPYYGYGDKTNALGVYASNVNFGLGLFVEDVMRSYLDKLSIEDLSKIDMNNLSFDSIAQALDINISDILSNLPIPMIDIAATAHIGEISAVGFDQFVDMKLGDINLNLNFGIKPSLTETIPEMPWINFASSMPGSENSPSGFKIESGDNPLYLDFQTSIFEVSIGNAELMVDEYLYLRGSFGIGFETALKARVSMGAIETFINSLANNELISIEDLLGDSANLGDLGLDLSTIPLDMYALTFAGSNLYGFAGIGGPYHVDTNNDGFIDDQDMINSGAIGIVIENAQFGMVFAMPTVVSELGLGGKLWPVFVTATLDIESASLVTGGDDTIKFKIEDVSVNINTFFLIAVIEEPTTMAIVNLAANAAFQVLGAPYINWEESYSDYTEDVNGNGILDKSEDLNNNGRLDAGEDINGNGVLDLREDWNGNGIIDDGGYYIKTGSARGVFLDYSGEIIGASVGYSEIDIAGLIQITGGISITKKGGENVTLSNGDETSVTTLSLSMTNVNAFVGYGAYFQDTNLNGRYDEDDIRNDKAVGLVLDDMNIAFVLMLETRVAIDELAIGFYTAAYASVGKVGLVGVENVTLQSEDLTFQFNTGIRAYVGLAQFDIDKNGNVILSKDVWSHLPLSMTTVDFSKSKWINSSLVESQGYAIGGDVDNPVVLMYSENLLKLSGEIDINIFNAVVLNGVTDIKISESDGLMFFGNFDASIGTNSTFNIQGNALALLIIDSRGVAGQFNFSSQIDLGGGTTIGGDFDVKINTTGQNIVYEVPKELQDNLDYETITISASPKEGMNPVDFYVTMSAIGYVNIMDSIHLDGEIDLLLSANNLLGGGAPEVVASLDIASTIDLGVIEPLVVAGTLGFFNGGLYGGLQVGSGRNTKLIDTETFSLNGAFVLQINTTNTIQQIKSFAVDGYGEYTGEYTYIDVAANTAVMNGAISIDVINVITMMGTASFVMNEQGIEGSSSLHLSLDGIGEIVMSANIAILNTVDEGLIFALSGESNFEFGLGVVGIQSHALIEINTSKFNEYANVEAGKIFNIELDGSLNIFSFNMGFAGSISYIDDVLELKIDNASLNFFDIATVDINGYANSNGDFYFEGNAHLEIRWGINILGFEAAAGVRGDISLVLSNTLLSGTISGELYAGFTGLLGWVEASIGTEATLTLTPYSASANFSVEIFGIELNQDFNWKFGEAPNIATQEGSIVYLNMGDRWLYRETDGSTTYKNTINEKYDIWQEGDTLYVSSLNETKSFTGVDKIIAYGGSGNDIFNIDSSVTKDLELHGGDGADTFNIKGAGLGTIIYADAGNDKIVTKVEGLHYYGGLGDDKFIGSNGIDFIDMGSGKNHILAYGGNDIIISDAGYIDAGSGDDVITSSMGERIDIIGGAGKDKLILADLDINDTLYAGAINGKSTLMYKYRELWFDSSLENMSIVDDTGDIVIEKLESNQAEFDWLTTSLDITTQNAVTIKEGTIFNISQGTLKITADTIDADFNIFKVANLELFVTNPVINVYYDASGKDVSFVSNSVVINAPIKSNGGNISFAPKDNTMKIVIGNTSENTQGVYLLDLTTLGYLENGFSAIVIGSDTSSGLIQIGDPNNTSGQIIFTDTVVIKNPGNGGEIAIDAQVVLKDGASFVIYGSGHTTTLSNNVVLESSGAVNLNDSLKINGDSKNDNTITISSDVGNIEIGSLTTEHFLNGNLDAIDDKLILTSNSGDVIINASVGNTDALEYLQINANDVIFNKDVIVNGDLIINATGNVEFNGFLNVSGNIIINGNIITFDSSVNTNQALTLVASSKVEFVGAVTVAKNLLINANEMITKSTLNVTNSINLTVLELDIGGIVTSKEFSIDTLNDILVGDGVESNTTLLLSSSEFNLIYPTVDVMNLKGNSLSLNYTNGDFTILSGNIQTNGDININVTNGNLELTKDIQTNGSIKLSASNDILLNGNVKTSNEKIEIISTNGSFIMDKEAKIENIDGTVKIDINKNIEISYINTQDGIVHIESTNGIISDVHNDNTTNVIANSVNLIGTSAIAQGYNIYSNIVKEAQNKALELSSKKIFTEIPTKDYSQIHYTMGSPYMGIFELGSGDWYLQFVNDTRLEKSSMLINQIDLVTGDISNISSSLVKWTPVAQYNEHMMDKVKEKTLEKNILNIEKNIDHSYVFDVNQILAYDKDIVLQGNLESFSINNTNYDVNLLSMGETSISTCLDIQTSEDFEYWIDELVI